MPLALSRDLLGLYLQGKYHELSEAFLTVLKKVQNTTYLTLDAQRLAEINAFVKQFLGLFTQPDCIFSDAHAVEFIRLNLTIANLVALSSFKTTDAYLEVLRGQPANFTKILALYSARNTAHFDRKAFFDLDPNLASAWYSQFGRAYRSGLVRPEVCDNLREHFAFKDDRLKAAPLAELIYFGATYVDGACDRDVKSVINRQLRSAVAGSAALIRNRPNPRKVAVLSGTWSPVHSSYRITYAYLKALRGYHLTYFQLGTAFDPDLSLFQEVRRIDFLPDGTLDAGSLGDNDFMVAYYPDVGMSPHSVVLANMRITPIQICSMGHSVSTWGADIDYFLSGADVEPPGDPGRNYSERLVLLPGSGAVHNRPAYTPAGRKKSVPEVVLNCPWSSQKVNYRLCRALREVLRRSVRKVRFRVFVGASLDRENDLLPFVLDLKAALPGALVEVCRGMAYAEYMAMLEEGDFAIDAFHFGGCNTVADSLFLRKLMVTWEGDRWYNRIGSQMVRQVGLPELAATRQGQYVDLVHRLIHDDGYRAALQARLDRADLDGTIFSAADAGYFQKALDYLIENHDRLRRDPDRSPIRIPR
jgi:hypothetical protein